MNASRHRASPENLRGQHSTSNAVIRSIAMAALLGLTGVGSMTLAQTAQAQQLAALLERGVADGYGWPVAGIFDLGWEKVTKFRLEPGFYAVEVNVLVNLDTWKGLNEAQRKVLSDAAIWLEGLDSENEALIKAERDKQGAAGIQPITFSEADSKAFLAKSNDVAWQSVIKRAPETGAKLRALAGN